MLVTSDDSAQYYGSVIANLMHTNFRTHRRLEITHYSYLPLLRPAGIREIVRLICWSQLDMRSFGVVMGWFVRTVVVV